MATFPIIKRKFKWQFPLYCATGGRKLFFYWCFTCKCFHWPSKVIKERSFCSPCIYISGVMVEFGEVRRLYNTGTRIPMKYGYDNRNQQHEAIAKMLASKYLDVPFKQLYGTILDACHIQVQRKV